MFLLHWLQISIPEILLTVPLPYYSVYTNYLSALDNTGLGDQIHQTLTPGFTATSVTNILCQSHFNASEHLVTRARHTDDIGKGCCSEARRDA